MGSDVIDRMRTICFKLVQRLSWVFAATNQERKQERPTSRGDRDRESLGICDSDRESFDIWGDCDRDRESFGKLGRQRSGAVSWDLRH